jgi:drug/metabolite transporter (DMT)-like permease
VASAAENRRGVVAMLTAMALFVSGDTMMKLAREVFPAGQAVALRTAFAALAAIIMVFALRDGGKLRFAFHPLVLARGAIESAATITYVWALGSLPLANMTAIVLASPIIIVVLAVLLRIESIGWRRAAAVIVGFCGVLVVVRPTADGFGAAALVALVSAVLVGCRDLMTRGIGNEVPSTVISLGTTAVVGVVAIAYGAAEAWQPVWRVEIVYLAIAAVLGTVGAFFIIGAFRNTDVGVISGYRYSAVIFAVIVGYLVWGDVPDPVAFCGMALIVGAGLYTMHRQRVRPDSNLKLPGRPPS